MGRGESWALAGFGMAAAMVMTVLGAWFASAVLIAGVIGMAISGVVLLRLMATRNQVGGTVRKHLIPTWSLSLDRSDRWPFRRLIPLSEAAQIALDKTQGTIHADLAKRLSPDDPLSYFGHVLWNDGYSQFYGTKPFQKTLSEVPAEEAPRSHIVDQGATIKYVGTGKVVATNVHMKRADLRRRIKEIKRGG